MTDSRPDPRIEHDSLGEVAVPRDALYGAATARARSWAFSDRRMPLAILHAVARIKAAAAAESAATGALPKPRGEAIESAALEVAAGKHDEHLVLDVFQTGSGTSSHMNVNEVVANRATQRLGAGHDAVHANDEVNRGQSSNDVMPSAVQLALLEAASERLLPALRRAIDTCDALADRHWSTVRNGRTHLMRATPIRFGQQFRGYANQLRDACARVETALEGCRELPLGGTAVGTGVGSPDGFAAAVCRRLCDGPWQRVFETAHHVGRQGSLDAVTWLVAAVATMATTLYKLANDLRWQSSDGVREVELPAMQPGSSIMPGKTNPVVCEAVLMACAQISGCRAVVDFANSQGQFELNTMIPLIGDRALEAVELAAGALDALDRHALGRLSVPDDAGDEVQQNPILVTALAPRIGYDRASTIAKQAAAEKLTVLEVARRETDLDEQTLARLLDPARMAGEFGARRKDAPRRQHDADS